MQHQSYEHAGEDDASELGMMLANFNDADMPRDKVDADEFVRDLHDAVIW